MAKVFLRKLFRMGLRLVGIKPANAFFSLSANTTMKFQLIAAITIPLVIGGVMSMVLISRMEFYVQFYETLRKKEVSNELIARHMQAAFKTQVQEWKDVLLRGAAPEDLKKYWQAFLMSESQVSELSQRLLSQSNPELRPQVQKFASDHAKMGVAYRQAFKTFRAGRGWALFEADRAVRGIDRQSNRDIEAIVSQIEARVEAATAKLQQSLFHEKNLVFAALFLIFVISGILLYMIMHRMQKADQGARERRRLESIGRVTAGVSHHFNNLLMIISGNAQLLREAHPPGTPEHETVTDILNSVTRGEELTRGLHAYANSALMQMGEAALNDLVEGLEDDIRQKAGEGVRLNFELEKDLWITRTDTQQLVLTILEITANAHDAMPDGGTLTVSTHNIKADNALLAGQPEARPGDYVQLAFSDTGEGINPQIIDRIFDPFFTTRETGQGSGLGLSAVYGLIRQSGGFTLAESKPEKGTTISLFFPRLGKA